MKLFFFFSQLVSNEEVGERGVGFYIRRYNAWVLRVSKKLQGSFSLSSSRRIIFYKDANRRSTKRWKSIVDTYTSVYRWEMMNPGVGWRHGGCWSFHPPEYESPSLVFARTKLLSNIRCVENFVSRKYELIDTLVGVRCSVPWLPSSRYSLNC